MLKNLLNLVYPLSCCACSVRLDALSESPLCTTCWSTIEHIQPPFCRICGRLLPGHIQKQAFICIDCQQYSFFFRKSRSACVYDGIIKQCIHLFKYQGKLSLVKPLSGLLIDCAHSSINMHEIDLIVPVPLHRSKLRQRQFNQAELLAQSLAKAFSKKLDKKALTRFESRGIQANLSGNQRRRNVHNAFGIKNTSLVKGKRILLVDDVLTTGATVNECAKMLIHSKAISVDVISLARSR